MDKQLFLMELLESSSSSEDDEIDQIVLKYVKEEIPKIKNYIEIVNQCSHNEVSTLKISDTFI